MEAILEQILDKYQSYIPDSNMLKNTLTPIVTESQLDYQRKEMQDRMYMYSNYIGPYEYGVKYINVNRYRLEPKYEVWVINQCIKKLKNDYKKMYDVYSLDSVKIHPSEYVRIERYIVEEKRIQNERSERKMEIDQIKKKKMK
jgi:hypothetical protein